MKSAWVDPGIRHSGLAVFVDRQLAFGRLVRNPVKHGDGPEAVVAMAQALLAELPHIEVLGFEVPRIYQGGKQKGDPNDLPSLAGIVYALAAYMGAHVKAIRYFPHEWKGTVNADVMTGRIRKLLTEYGDIASVEPCPAYLEHNVLDAAGIGLHHLDRLKAPSVICGGVGTSAR